MTGWIDVKARKPEQMGENEMAFSPLVDVMLDNGKEDEDFTINGKWVMYCEKNTSMPQIVYWRPKNT